MRQPESVMRDALHDVVTGGRLTAEEAHAVMLAMTTGEVANEVVGGLLCALATRGESSEEIAGFARGMRERALRVVHTFDDAVDTCGTGGDRHGTINISTAAALVATAAGAHVVKHGNRAISSQCGSADVLEALGVVFPRHPEEARQQLERTGFTFLFAPAFHPAMKAVAPIRRRLGVRTVFNILGPLTNPAYVRYQVLGVFHPDLMEKLAPVFAHLGHRRVRLVHHESGMDEAASFGRTRTVSVDASGVREEILHGRTFGFASGSVEDLRGADARANAQRLESLVAGEGDRVFRETVLLNAALALEVCGHAASLEEGLEQAENALREGRVREVLERLRQPVTVG